MKGKRTAFIYAFVNLIIAYVLYRIFDNSEQYEIYLIGYFFVALMILLFMLLFFIKDMEKTKKNEDK
ncbi:MAG: hypothetical protein LBV47_01185 [Bacteroidales bacterium]|jgi:phosphotransferase system  glucose/maltose/N-acetylglucosamine-specific IIC component|nr:hypothetical protein [Bacteroidales bacterium]